ncbi:MAG: sulfotransferase [Acidobacteriota bacterium]|nr:sulfotransferase [Acidobacteriota bacterium]
MRAGGLFIGEELNNSEDAIEFGDYSDRWVSTYIPHWNSELSVKIQAQMTGDLECLLETHCASLSPARPWGWKEPRTIFLLAFFHKYFPNMKFLHVVRDGRDMACSANQNQLESHRAERLFAKALSPTQQDLAVLS